MDGIRYRRGTTEYLVDANRPYQEVLEEWVDGDGPGGDDPVLAMEYALGAERLWQRTGGGSPEQRWFHGDAQLSTRLLTTPGAPGSIAATLTYEAFGSDVGLGGTPPTAYRYTGQQADATTGGYYLRARHMDPRVGRLITEDPFAGLASRPPTLHRYQYALDSPTNLTDPSGEFADVSIVNVMGGLAVFAGLNSVANAALWRFPRELHDQVDEAIDLLKTSNNVNARIAAQRLSLAFFRSGTTVPRAWATDPKSTYAYTIPALWPQAPTVVLSPKFFSLDRVGRAMVLAHEGWHLGGSDERDAYKVQWDMREDLGFTREIYWNSELYQTIREWVLNYEIYPSPIEEYPR